MSIKDRGKLIVVEGLDGSGKETQTKRLYDRLKYEGINVKKIAFPRYNSESSALIKMYLNGEFGDKATDVNPYVASTFYAVDRYASFKQEWEQFYKEGGIVIADRYTTSNMIHQAGKIKDREEKEKFLKWLWDFEFNIYGLPAPDLVFFLDVSVEFNKRLMEGRKNKFTGEAKKDIHERDLNHLLDAYNNAMIIAEKYQWQKIECVKDNKLRSISDIHNEIYKEASKII
ncbi:MAG: dTMP kinase [Clostridia bacterium]|nr:putative thymidylate kinase [Clostridiales bacterium]MDK2986319.1 dTMP kinase [Clostridia bacterium]